LFQADSYLHGEFYVISIQLRFKSSEPAALEFKSIPKNTPPDAAAAVDARDARDAALESAAKAA